VGGVGWGGGGAGRAGGGGGGGGGGERDGGGGGVAEAQVRSWRLAAVVADTWKGFSNLAGLSSTVTFVTVTHAILEPQPSTAKNQARRSSAIQRRASVKGRARTRACRSRRGRKGDAWSCIRAHV